MLWVRARMPRCPVMVAQNRSLLIYFFSFLPPARVLLPTQARQRHQQQQQQPKQQVSASLSPLCCISNLRTLPSFPSNSQVSLSLGPDSRQLITCILLATSNLESQQTVPSPLLHRIFCIPTRGTINKVLVASSTGKHLRAQHPHTPTLVRNKPKKQTKNQVKSHVFQRSRRKGRQHVHDFR